MEIPVYRPMLTKDERTSLLSAFDSGWISGAGPQVSDAEHKLGQIYDCEALAVCNGTAALHLALVAAGLGPGDKVLVPTFGYVAPANAAVYCGAVPIFVDCDSEHWQSNLNDFQRQYSDDIKGLIIVYTYGAQGKVLDVVKWARSRGLLIIEDCAEALGTRVGGELVGTLGDVAILSFYGNKTITCGEGGAVLSRQPQIIERAKKLRGQGLASSRQYWHEVVGFNYRLSNVCAALLLPQIERLDTILGQKRSINDWYVSNLDSRLKTQQFAEGDIPWMTSVLLPGGIDRDAFTASLKKAGIETRPLFYPIHTMPPYFSSFSPLRSSESLALRGFNLPSGPATTIDELEFISMTCTRLLDAAS